MNAYRGAPAGQRRRIGHKLVSVLHHGLALCQPGDVLVFACGSSLATVAAMLRDTEPEAARRIAEETAT